MKKNAVSIPASLATLLAPPLLFLSAPVQLSYAAVVEEVLVTARKREESLQDVPISVQAVAGEQIAEQNIIDIESLAPYVPAFTYSQSPGASDIYFMRGLGTFGSGAHFEPSIGQVFNGFFSTRSRLGRSALVDVAQVEVLKGPQGAIIGKNTSLGAINITSRKPTDTFEAELAFQYNFDASEGYDVEGFVSGPLTDQLRGRAVVNYRDVDGWVERPTGDEIPKKEDLTVRLLLDVDITDNVMVEFMYQRTDFDREGKGRTINGCLEFGPFSVAGAQAIGYDCSGADDNTQTLDIRRARPGGPPFNSGEPFTLENDMFGITVTADFESLTFTSLSNWFAYDITDVFSGDQNSSITPIGAGFTSVPGERISIQNAEDYEQWYQELRVNSTGDNVLDYIAGVMFFRGEMDITQTFHAVAGAIGPPVPPINPAVSRNEFAGSKTDSQAAFGQVDWHINDRFTVTFGGRFTHEERDGNKAQQVGEIYTRNLAAAPIPCDTPTSPLSACTHGNDGLQPGGTPLTGSIRADNFSYNASLVFNLNDDNTFYFTNATGFKSGGFDLRGAGDPARFIFPEEETDHFELGGKHTFLDGALRANWAVFHTEVEDLQTAANDPIIISQIVAPADITSEGFEWDLLWVPIDYLTLSFTGAYADAEYDDFIGSCYLSQPELGSGCFNTMPMGPALVGVQDLSGKQAVYAPEWSFVLGGDYTWPLAGNMELTVSAKWIYLDEYFTAVEQDPLSLQEQSDRVDASLVLSGTLARGNPWSLALIGKNLTDETVLNFTNSSTLSSQAVLNTSIQETRFIGLRATVGW